MSEDPPPPPPPPPPPNGSPRLYMTPYLAKRKDGLCPSLFREDYSTIESKTPGVIHKPYQTSSNLLLQVKPKDGIPKHIIEIQTIVDSINRTLKAIVDTSSPDKDHPIIGDVKFKVEGCIWKIEFISSENAKNDYRMEIICSANDTIKRDEITYVIDSILIPKKTVDPNPMATPLPGTKDAKAIYEKVMYTVRKSIVKLEMPDFPEGCKGRSFKEIYQLNARLKSGSFATVCRGTHRATGRKVAIKCVLRKDLPLPDDAAIYDEVAILASLHHPHIVPIIDFFDEKDCYFIVMELMCGGDLFDRIGKKKSYSEADARDLVLKMLKAVSICHQRNIAHCDMKPKNLLLVSEEDDSYIKLADFGFAARVHRPKSLTKQCGTPFFVAPEILTRKPYDQQSDMWSVGCIVFLLLSGNLPFLGRNQKELFRKIVAGKFEFQEDAWNNVSDDAKDLVKKLIVLNPDNRITAKAALLHPWLKVESSRLSKNGLNSTSQKLKTFNAKMKLRSAMIAVDYISSMMQVSGMSARNLAKSSGGSSASSGSSSKSSKNSKGSLKKSLSISSRRRRQQASKNNKEAASQPKEEMVSI